MPTGEVSRDNHSADFHIYKRTPHWRGEHACGSHLTVLHLTLRVAAGAFLSDKYPGGRADRSGTIAWPDKLKMYFCLRGHLNIVKVTSVNVVTKLKQTVQGIFRLISYQAWNFWKCVTVRIETGQVLCRTTNYILIPSIFGALTISTNTQWRKKNAFCFK